MRFSTRNSSKCWTAVKWTGFFEQWVLCLCRNRKRLIITDYSTIIYKKVFSDNSQIQLINALNGTFGILFTLNATWTVDRFGRRFLFLVGAVGMALCMLVAAAVVTETPE